MDRTEKVTESTKPTMTSPNVTPRRILSLPAIRPCESISPATLLASLISLAADIGSNPTRSPVHQKLIREALRHVAILLSFFRDMSGSGPDLPGSATLSLSELHVTLQKLRFLLHDCSRRGARLWILVNSDRVVSEFRVLTRSIAVALDVFPMDCADVSDEAKEAVLLLARQAWRMQLKSDPEDDQAVDTVRAAIARFASGVSPNGTELNSLLHRLQIRSWSECSDEIAFMEEQISECSNEDGELLALLVYCRATLFKVNGIEARKEPKIQEAYRIDGLDPEGFRCPISLETMTDPVTISTGQTYDRASIVRWLKNGYMTCPVTGEKLDSTEFVPNLALQRIIHQYCRYYNIAVADSNSGIRRRDLAKTSTPRSSAADGATRMTVALLVSRLSSGSNDEKDRAAYEIRLISKSSIFVRACLVEADCVAWLLHLLSTSDPSIQDNAAAALLNLSKHPNGRTAIFDIGGISLIIDVVTEGLKVKAKQNAAAILFYLSSVEEYRQEIGEIPEAIPALVSLLKRGTYRGKKNAVVALYGLLLFPGNQLKVITAGAAGALIDLLTDEREDLVNDCVGVLAKIAERREGTNAILRASSNVLPSIVEVMQSSTSRLGREYCVSVMLSLCNNGGPKVIGLMEKMPPLMPALYSVVADGSPQASKKARSLINCIHQNHDQDCPGSAVPPPVQDHIVHAR